MSLRLVGVTKRYGAQAALDRVSIHVRAGDIYGFIGHNGSGKTTAMRVALGLIRANEGRVLVDGFDAARHPREARARMGALIESPGFHGGWSGARNLAELARVQGFSRRDAEHEARALLDRVGLSHAADKAAHAYSHGMRQRLGIAQALIGSPRYVLLDEPTNGLDPEGIAEIREVLRALNQERGTTLLISSHQLHEIAALCTRIGVLRAGRLVAESETSVLLASQGRYRVEAADTPAAVAALHGLGLEPVAQAGGLVVDLRERAPVEVSRALFERGVSLSAFAPLPQTLEEIYVRFSRASASAPPVHEPPEAPAAPREPLAPPAPVLRALCAEVRRWWSAPAVPVLLCAPAVLGAITMARRGAEAARDTEAVAGRTLFSATDVNGFEVVGQALQAGLPVLAFATLGLASQSLAAELGRGTLRNLLLRPLTRAQAALGKIAALCLAALASYALLAGTAVGIAHAAFGFGDVSELLPNGARFVLVPAAQLWPDLHLALLSPVLPLLAYATLGFLCSAFARSGAAALAYALGAGVVLDLARAVLRGLGWAGALPADHLPSPLSDTSFVRFYVDVSQGISNARFDHAGLVVWVPVLWILVCSLLAVSVLTRRDVP